MMRSDESAIRASRRPWWQDLRWITAGVLVAFLATLCWGLFGPEPPITVSRNTTYLTAPLAADGLPDYGAAVLAAMDTAPKPEENAAVELLQVMWPLGIDAADLPAVCQALGIPAVPPADPLRAPTKDAATKVTDDMDGWIVGGRVAGDPAGSGFAKMGPRRADARAAAASGAMRP